VTVTDKLACLTARCSESETHDDAVKAALEDAEQVLTGDSGLTAGLFVVDTELLLKDSVEAAGLLLLAKLDSVFALLLTTATVVSGWIITTINGALRRKAALTLEEELLAFAAALLALCRCIASH
jgi:hypothetical protein